MLDVIIIGAGPAGLTAGYELLKKTNNILILEKQPKVGGLAQTKIYGDYRYDIGPHRFFTKNEEVYNLFLDVLDKDAVKVSRKTRILFKGKYFDYPLTPINALFGLGVFESFSILFSYIGARIKRLLNLNDIKNFEDWVIDRFGKKLFNNFFKNYTEKVWGIDCKDIGKDWAAQRIKGLSLLTAVKFALFPNSKKRPKTLVDEFYYPKLGAGMLWEKFEEIIEKQNVPVLKNSNVISIDNKKDSVIVTYLKDEKEVTVESKAVFFSNPLLEFLKIFNNQVPKEVQNAAESLEYRNHISVHLTVDKKLFDDNWIYVHSPNLNLARIADFTNFSPHMSREHEYPLTLEYFCYESEDIWQQNNKEIIDFAISELKTIFKSSYNIVHSEVTRNAKAYPVIRTGFEDKIEIIKTWLKTQEKITAIGRSGMFKYNNQDHAMATGMYAARNYLGIGDFDPWDVNVDGEYLEEISAPKS